MTVARLLAVAAALAVPVACALAPRAPRPQNLVIVTLDTTRADRLPMYGYASVATPALDRLAREGVVFDEAMTVAPLTLTAHSSLFTGLYPPRHRVRDNTDAALDPAHTTMAEVWRANGFRTAAFVGSTVLASDRGLAQGFDVYDDGSAPGRPAPRRRPGNEVVDRALAWLDAGATSPFFLWVHLYDVHGPQKLPDEYRRVYGGDPYVGGIAFADAQIARLVRALERTHVLDKTAVVVAGDHGESLGDHGELEHGLFVYESVLHVPLVIRSPGVAPGRISTLTSLVDVLPTALDLFHFGSMPIDGRSLLPALRGRPMPERPAYAESMYALHFGWSPMRVLRDGRFKLIDAPRPELFDLETDPFEEHDLAGSRPATVIAMQTGLRAFDDAGLSDAIGAATSPPSEVRERLAALGYASGVRRIAPGAARDPKDYIQIYNASRHATAAR